MNIDGELYLKQNNMVASNSRRILINLPKSIPINLFTISDWHRIRYDLLQEIGGHEIGYELMRMNENIDIDELTFKIITTLYKLNRIFIYESEFYKFKKNISIGSWFGYIRDDRLHLVKNPINGKRLKWIGMQITMLSENKLKSILQSLQLEIKEVSELYNLSAGADENELRNVIYNILVELNRIYHYKYQ